MPSLHHITPAPGGSSVPMPAGADAAVTVGPALSPRPQLSRIEQKELRYLSRLPRELQLRVGDSMPTCRSRVAALGTQLRTLHNLGFGRQCHLGERPLGNVVRRYAEPLLLGQDLMKALPDPQVFPPRMSFADWGYAGMLQAAVARTGNERRALLADAARMITLATHVVALSRGDGTPR